MSTVPPDDAAPQAAAESPSNIDALMDVQMPVSIRFGETQMVLEDIMKLGVGSVVELNAAVNDPVELIVNGKRFARGEAVTVDGFYGIRITEINKSRRADDTFFSGGQSK